MNNRRSFIVGIKSIKLSKKEKHFLKKYKPWGVILFSRNIKDIKQTFKLTSSIRKVFKDKRYPILVDQEGGRVNRLKNIISFDNLTSEFFGNKFIKNYREFNFFYKLFIDKTSYLLRLLGININTVPVLDLKIKGANKVIGDRSFSRNPKIVSKIGDYCINYHHNNGIGTVIKHIPGHGCSSIDSHKEMPKVNLDIRELNKIDFYPFKSTYSKLAMTAHILYSKIDSKNVSTFSKKIIQEIIRKKIGFQGILMSDDISMRALKYDLITNAKKSLSAGCNLVLYCAGNIKDNFKLIKSVPYVDQFTAKKTSEIYKILR